MSIVKIFHFASSRTTIAQPPSKRGYFSLLSTLKFFLNFDRSFRLYNCYNVCVAVLILAEPWLISMGGSLDRETSEDGRLGDESLAVFQLCETVSRVCFAVLVNFRDFEVVGNKLQTAFLKPLANILTISNGADFFVLEAFLVCLSTVSDEGVELGCESSSRIVAQSTLHLMSHLFIEIRSAFNSVAFSMKKKKFSTVCKIEAIVRAIVSVD